MQITLEVSDRLGEKLQQLGDRLPEAFDRALQELIPTETIPHQDEHQIVQILASQPSPEAILAIRPNPNLQARMSELKHTHILILLSVMPRYCLSENKN